MFFFWHNTDVMAGAPTAFLACEETIITEN